VGQRLGLVRCRQPFKPRMTNWVCPGISLRLDFFAWRPRSEAMTITLAGQALRGNCGELELTSAAVQRAPYTEVAMSQPERSISPEGFDFFSPQGVRASAPLMSRAPRPAESGRTAAP
jgi:hypothetical protein